MLLPKLGLLAVLLRTRACYASSEDGSVNFQSTGFAFDNDTSLSNPGVDQALATFVIETVEPIRTATPYFTLNGPPPTRIPSPPRDRPIRTKGGNKGLKIRMCNNDNFDAEIGRKWEQTGCIMVDAHEGKCKKYLWHSPVTAFSMPSEWKCMLYSRENCRTKDGRMTLIEEATANIGPHMNDRMQSFRCLQQYDEKTDERGGAWMCNEAFWSGHCAWQRPALGRCFNLPGKLKDKAMSLTPQTGNVCTVYEHPRCNVEKAGYSVTIEAPGAPVLGYLMQRISSIRCWRNETAGREKEIFVDELRYMTKWGFGNDGKKPKVMTTENWDLDFEFETESTQNL